MTIHAYQYRLPLRRELLLGAQRHTHREGILLERDGRWAEASPLPAFSRESIKDVLMSLRTNREPPPSLAFALDCLEQPMGECTVPVNALLQGSTEDVVAAANDLGSTVCSAVKVKVGRHELKSDIALVHRVRKQLHDEQQLRLDANRAWTFDEASEFAKGIEALAIEYIEEPLQDSTACDRLFETTGLPYALDETLAEHSNDFDIVEHFPNVAALVCKPTILGGRRRVEWLAATGKPIVFSAAFESGVGIGRIAQLTREFSPDVPAGLDTYAWLENDVLKISPSFRDGFVHFASDFDVKIGGLRRIEL